MAKFLTTNGVSSYLERIIVEAREDLIIISPYLKISKTFYERLKDASFRGIRIRLVYGKDELKPNEKNSLAGLDKIKLYFFENLHAKCYLNEKEMIITSMNMHEFSEKNNREMGVLLTKQDDTIPYLEALNEIKSIIQSSESIDFTLTDRRAYRNEQISKGGIKKNENLERGYCIRCEKRIQFDPKKPYCSDCYASWARFENPGYKEKVCHSCGEFESTSMAKPLCYRCFRQ